MKKIIFILFLLLMPFAFADSEQTFTNLISVQTYYTQDQNNTNLTTAVVNITTEQDSHIYNCLQNKTFSFNFGLKRNTSDPIDSNQFKNLTANMNSLVSTCDQIAKQYGDVNSYFKLYTTCNTDFELCKKDKEVKDSKISEMSQYKTTYDKCATDLSDNQQRLNSYSSQLAAMQTNITATSQDLQNSNKKIPFWFFVGLGIGLGAHLYWKNRFAVRTQREKLQTGMSARRFH